MFQINTLFVVLAASLLSPVASSAAGGNSGFGYRQVSPGVFRGGRPAKDEKIQWLADQGIRNIVNFQGNGMQSQPGEKPEEIARAEEAAKRLGLGYFRRPFSTGSSYVLPPEERATILNTVELMKNPAMHPIYVHCFFGVDRTGVTVASFRILAQGCSFEKARDEMYKEGGPWTKYATQGQLPFLQDLTKMERPDERACPL